MTITQVIDPFHIATMGVTGDPITIATDGFIVFISEEIVEVPVIGGRGTLVPWEYPQQRKQQTKKKKKITAKVVINGVTYTETILLDDLTITAKDISVTVSDAKKPQISIQVMRKEK